MAGKKKGSSRKKRYRVDITTGEFRGSSTVGTAILNGETFRGRGVQFYELEGRAIFEGDIDLGPVREVKKVIKLAQRAPSDPAAATELQSVILVGQNVRWPNCVIPLEFKFEVQRARAS